MKPATRLAWYWMYVRRYVPVATQYAVAYGRVGTCIDLVVRDESQPGRNLIRTVECKKGTSNATRVGSAVSHTFVCCFELGCATNYTDDITYLAPYANVVRTTHSHYVLQALASDAMYHAQVPLPAGCERGTPLLVRFDGDTAYEYEPEAWAVAGLPALLQKMK